MANEKGVKLTDGRKSLIKALAQGSKSWSELRKAYYGEERAKQTASTSFVNQLTKMKEMNVIVKMDDKYVLGEVGKTLLEANQDILSGEFKSKAQLGFEANVVTEVKA